MLRQCKVKIYLALYYVRLRKQKSTDSSKGKTEMPQNIYTKNINWKTLVLGQKFPTSGFSKFRK